MKHSHQEFYTTEGYKQYFRHYQGQPIHTGKQGSCFWHHLQKDAKFERKYYITKNYVFSETVEGQMDKPDNYTLNYNICQKALKRKYMQNTSFFTKNLRYDLAM